MIIIIFTALDQLIKSNEGIAFIIKYIGNKLFPYLRYNLELFLFISAFLSLSNNTFEILAFSLASVITILKTLFLQNITLRKD